MSRFRDVIRVYDPDVLKMMTSAFDRACGFLPADVRGNDTARKRLALLVIRHVDQGERDPLRISNLVRSEYLRWAEGPSGTRSPFRWSC